MMQKTLNGPKYAIYAWYNFSVFSPGMFLQDFVHIMGAKKVVVSNLLF